MRIELFSSEYLNIVEINTTGDNENYIKGDSESKYVESEVFNLFANCLCTQARLLLLISIIFLQKLL